MSLSRSRARQLLDSHQLSPRRSLGQNFVVDPNTVRRIARLAEVTEGDHVVEIGPGLGSLTLALADTGARIVAVEIDAGLMPVLEEVLAEPVASGQVQLRQQDALDLEWAEELSGDHPWTLVANLPYNVATPLVLDVLDHVPQVQRMLVMVQREVAERLAAGAGTPSYGIPSVKVAYHATARLVGRVPATVFDPPPRVESALVALRRLPAPATDADPQVLFGLVREAFAGRRKMLRRSLAGRVSSEQFAQAGIDPGARPEQLDVVMWGRLAQAVAAEAS